MHHHVTKWYVINVWYFIIFICHFISTHFFIQYIIFQTHCATLCNLRLIQSITLSLCATLYSKQMYIYTYIQNSNINYMCNKIDWCPPNKSVANVMWSTISGKILTYFASSIEPIMWRGYTHPYAVAWNGYRSALLNKWVVSIMDDNINNMTIFRNKGKQNTKLKYIHTRMYI